MCSRCAWIPLVAVCWLAILSQPTVAQDRPAPGTETLAPTPESLLAAGERPGSPVESLEGMTTGRRIRERGSDSEEADEIETDRDSFTPATSLTPRRRIIAEVAYSFVERRAVKESHSFPELIVRYGLTDRIELRLGWNAEMGGAGSSISGAGGEGDFAEGPEAAEREYTISYGLKLRVSDQQRWIPRSALIVQGFTPTGGSTGASTATQFIATYVAGWELPNRWRFDTAIRYGIDSDEGDRFNQWAPSAVLRVPIGERWAAHAEYFGLFTTGKERNTSQHYFSPGLHWLASPDLELGFRLGWGLNDQSARFFVNAGLGWRY